MDTLRKMNGYKTYIALGGLVVVVALQGFGWLPLSEEAAASLIALLAAAAGLAGKQGSRRVEAKVDELHEVLTSPLPELEEPTREPEHEVSA